MGDRFKAIVLARNSARAFAFEAFAPALDFMQSNKVDTVIVEFSVETEKLDFYDAAKKLEISIIFANALAPWRLPELGIRDVDVIYPERRKQFDSFADFRARPGIKGSVFNARH